MTVTASPPTNRLGPILTELRPRQWAKNLLVVAAPAGARVIVTESEPAFPLVALATAFAPVMVG